MSEDDTKARRRPRSLRVGAQALTALFALYGASQALVHLPSFRAYLRDRAASALGERLGKVEVGADARVDWLFRVSLGPIAVSGTRAGDPILLRVDSVRIRPSLSAFVGTGHLSAASVYLRRVRIALPDRPGIGRELVERFRTPSSPPARAGEARGERQEPVVRADDVTLSFTLGGHRLTAGPLEVHLHRRHPRPGESSTTASLRLPGDGQGTVVVERDREGFRATARFDGISERDVPEGLLGRAASWSGGTVSLIGSGNATADLGRARARVELTTADLQLAGTMVGAEPVGPFGLDFAGELSWDAKDLQLLLENGRLGLHGGDPISLTAELRLSRDLPCRLAVRADGIEFLRTVSSLPPLLGLPEDAPHPLGTLDARVNLSGPLFRPEDWTVDASLDLSRMREAAKHAPRVALNGPFVHEAETEVGPPRAILVGPDNPDFVPLHELPSYLVRAVTASEDAGFFGHSGFDFEELRNAAVQGAQAGRVVRGGSTISQQLAKNLYLSREKTLARKLREAIVTVALEATVPKQRLLEIYLNVAEWGPGLYGIGPAARHWFGKDARALTPREAAFLARVIPGPIRYHAMWHRGAPSELWLEHVDDLLRTMYGQGTLSAEDLETALKEPIVFAHPGAEPVSDGAVGPTSVR